MSFPGRSPSRTLRLAFGALLTFALASYFFGALSYLRIYYAIVAAAAGSALLLLCARRSLPADMLRSGGLLAAFYMWLALTSLWALDPVHTVATAAFDLIYPTIWLTTFVFVRFGRLRDVYVPMRVLPWAVGALYAYMLLTWGVIRPEDVHTAEQIGALGNAGALTLLACLPFLVLRALRGMRGSLIESLLTLGLLLMSQSRAGYLLGALMVAATVLAARPLGRRGVLRVLGGGLVVLAATIALVVFSGGSGAVESTLERFTAVEDFAAPDNSAQTDSEVERLAMFAEGFNAWYEHRWLGIGYENLAIYVEARHGFPVVSHNLLITLIAECGWPALLLFTAIIADFYRRTRQVQQRAPSKEARDLATAARISMLGLLIGSMVHPLLHLQLFFVVLGIGAALRVPLSALLQPDRVLRQLRVAANARAAEA
jgi:hypothetical protein